MSKRFRHRFNFAMYDDSFVDTEIIDYISNHEAGHARQEAIRSLLRAGFSSLIKNNDSKQASIDSIDPKVLNAAIQTLNNITNAGHAQSASHGGIAQGYPQQSPHNQERPNAEQHSSHNQHTPNVNNEQTIDKTTSENNTTEDNKDFKSSIKIDKSKQFTPIIDESTNQATPEDKENRDLSLDIDDDDIVDPMSMFGDDLSGEGGML